MNIKRKLTQFKQTLDEGLDVLIKDSGITTECPDKSLEDVDILDPEEVKEKAKETFYKCKDKITDIIKRQ